MSIGVIEGAHAMARGLGYECSGVVRHVGPAAKTLQLGDRVICNGSGCFTSLATASEKLCTKIPDSLDFIEASTMPIVYCTVIYGLVDIAKMQKGNVGFWPSTASV